MKRNPKIFNWSFCIIFILFAIVQYNDPDPLNWIAIYLAGAWICYEATRGVYRGWFYLVCTLIFSCYAGWLFFTGNGVLSWMNEHNEENLVQTMKATKPWIEQTREFGGLFILLLVMAINWFYFRPATAKA